MRAIADAVYRAEPSLYNFSTVRDTGEAVSSFLRSRYPDLSDEAVKVATNRDAFDWK